MQAPWLPFASSLCGACAEVCPVKIDIPRLLLKLRSEVKKAEARERQSGLERLGFRLWAWVMRHPRIYEMLGLTAAAVLASQESNGRLRRPPALLNRGPLRAWFSQRDLPALPERSFRQAWRARARVTHD